MRRKILSIFLVAVVATLVGALVSCSPSPETGGGGGGQDITIPKVLLFENNSSVATDLLRAIYYERTETAHKFYVKTTFVITKYSNDIAQIDPGIMGSDIWAQLIIGIDRESVNAPSNNIIRLGKSEWGTTDTRVFTSDSTFQFDAVIRVISHSDNKNTEEGLPLFVENDNILIEFIRSDVTAQQMADDAYWNNVVEKKFQGGTGDGPDKFLSGSYTEATKGSTTFRLDRNIKYENGEYVFTIPFTVIDVNDIKKVTVFGLQNKGWRGGQGTAVIKPLGSSKVIVYADPSGVVKGIPVVTVPKNKNESPSLIQGSFPDVLQLTVSLDAKAGVLTNTNTITLITSTSNDASNAIVFTGPKGNSTAYVTNWLYYGGTNNQGDVLYTNKVVLILAADNLGGADFYAGTNYSISVSSLGATATISVTVEPTISLSLPVLIPGNSANATVTVIDGYDPSTVTIKNSNTGATHTVNLTSANGTNSGTFTIGEAGANLIASNNHVIFAIYNDTTSGKYFTNTQTFYSVLFTIIPPSITDTSDGSFLSNNTSIATISNVYITNYGGYLYVGVWADNAFHEVAGDNRSIVMFIDKEPGIQGTNLNKNFGQAIANDIYFTNSEFSPEIAVIAKIKSSTGFFAMSYTNTALYAWNTDDIVVFKNDNRTYVEFKIPLANLGLSSGNSVKLIFVTTGAGDSGWTTANFWDVAPNEGNYEGNSWGTSGPTFITLTNYYTYTVY